jgi:TonB family protein
VKEYNNRYRRVLASYKAILVSITIFSACVLSAFGQAASTDTEAMQKRIARARALAAAHSLTAAAFELDSIRNSTTDDAVRDVARIMLMGIYFEQGDYGRVQSLLDETFKARTSQNESSSRSYFAVAGQTIRGVRLHLDRYKAFGLNAAGKDLPAEAISDLDKVRALLERMVQQAKEIGADNDRNIDAFALLEDVANVRAGLSRTTEERAQWQSEVAEARERLAASESRLTSINGQIASTNPATVLLASTAVTPPPPTVTSSDSAVTSSKSIEAPKKTDSSSGAKNDQGVKLANGQILNLGPLVEKATQKVSPTYPPFAKTARVTGVVRVDLVVDEKGLVSAAQSSTGPEVLRQAAVDAARRWKFNPTLKDGLPVRVTGFLNFNFSL